MGDDSGENPEVSEREARLRLQVAKVSPEYRDLARSTGGILKKLREDREKEPSTATENDKTSHQPQTREEKLKQALIKRVSKFAKEFGKADIRFEPSVIEGAGKYVVDVEGSVPSDALVRGLGLKKDVDFQREKHPEFPTMMRRFRIEQAPLEEALPGLAKGGRVNT